MKNFEKNIKEAQLGDTVIFYNEATKEMVNSTIIEITEKRIIVDYLQWYGSNKVKSEIREFLKSGKKVNHRHTNSDILKIESNLYY